jgi:hypothetical protein
MDNHFCQNKSILAVCLPFIPFVSALFPSLVTQVTIMTAPCMRLVGYDKIWYDVANVMGGAEMSDSETVEKHTPHQAHGKSIGPLWKTECSRRAITTLSAVWIAAMLLPLLLLCFYAHPLHDDYIHIQSAAEAWASTGSLIQTLLAAFTHTITLYQTWQGTYLGMFLSCFTPMAFSNTLYFITPLFALCALALSAWYFVRAAACAVFHLSMRDTLPVYAVLLTLWLGYLLGADEVLYWQSGTPYAYSAVMLALMAGLLIKQHFWAPRARRSIALVLCATALGGLTYPLALGGTLALLFITFWAFRRHSRAAKSALLTFVFAAASLTFVAIAPGNTVRQASYGAPMAPFNAIVHGVAECLQTTGGWLSPQLAAAGLLLSALLWKPLRDSGASFRNPLLFFIFSFGALAAAFVPAIYATGLEAARVDRIQASLYLAFILVALGNLVYWLGWAAVRYGACRPSLARWKVWLCALLAVWGLFASAIRATPIICSTLNLLNGNAARYASEMTARENAIAAAPTMDEALAAVTELTAHPYLFASDGLTLGKDSIVPAMHRYFALQALLKSYPAGAIPTAEWEKLNAWPTSNSSQVNTQNGAGVAP